MKLLNKYLAVGTAAAIAVSASTFASAAPIGIGSGQLALQNAEVSDVIDVSSRGRRNTAIGAAVIGGMLLGGAIAHGGYYAPQPYYYAAPPPPPPQRCWVQTGPYRGQGYWAYC
jgi:hypothetical protein